MPPARRVLPGTDVETSALGFGCVRLTACRSEAEALRTLHAALDNGVTHFDTARLYGSGHSERILGRFLADLGPRRQGVTVTTKLGLLPAGGLAKRRRLVSFAKTVLGPFPRLLARAKRRVAAGGQAGAFDVESARNSLETSLRTLGLDAVDVLLLHEATLADAASGPLQRFLEDQRRRGTVRALGLGTGFGRLNNDAALVPAMYPVLQFEHNAATPNLDGLANRRGRGIVIHSIFAPLPALRDFAARQPAAAGEWATRVGADLADPRVLISLLLHFATASNPDGITLFSSQSPANIAANAADAARRPFTPAQLAAFAEHAASVKTSVKAAA